MKPIKESSQLTVCKEPRQPTKAERIRERKRAEKQRFFQLKKLKERMDFLFKPIYGGKILSIKKQSCYVIVEEMTGTDYGPAFKIKYACSPNGDYLGDTRTAYRLVNKYGISVFEKTNPLHCVCTIGYSLEKRKWYGWSHRAIYGFKRKQQAARFAKSVS